MKGRGADLSQTTLFSTLEELLNPEDTLYKLSDRIPWDRLDKEFSSLYSSEGRPAKPIRLMISLLLLKQMYNLGDETVLTSWVRNPYWQYFSGYTIFQWNAPLAASDLVHFRHRIVSIGL